MKADDLITQAAKLGASDIHLTVGRPPVIRLHGILYPLDAAELKGKLDQLAGAEMKVLLPEETDALAREIMTGTQYEKFKERGTWTFPTPSPA
jgi:Tfp pilus assembly protein, pilus retraction ATPase PilT